METPPVPPSFVNRTIRFSLDNKLVVFLVLFAIVFWGTLVAPFDWEIAGLPRDPVPVDAIPDIGENQQIVFTDWEGRSPQDVEDQITYPLTVALLGIPGVKTIRSFSMFGFASIYIIFKEDIEFYWSRSRILEKLNSLPPNTLPEGVRPMLGPDATALGQVYWYTLEGRDKDGRPAGGWDLDELRSVQDWYVRYSLQSVEGVSEVASVGGFVKEYQIDVDPDAMRAYGVTLMDIFQAVRQSNLDVGARTIEVNQVEYIIRGIGFIKKLSDVENIVLKSTNNIPIYLKSVAKVQYGPALRRGVLDKAGAEAVGGIVVVRFGENPLAAIKRVKAKIAEIAPGLPKKTLADGTLSQVTIVPFYDRTGLIYETLGTLNEAISLEILVTIIVVIFMVLHLRSSLLISGLLPLAVLMTFIMMRQFKVDANIVALSGIAIAIGTMVDMGIVLCENILRHLQEAHPGESPKEVVFRASTEVGSAVLTAVATTIVGFLPVFTMEAAEGKLFKPLAYTKTFALASSIIVALTIIPPLAELLFPISMKGLGRKKTRLVLLAAVGAVAGFALKWWLGLGILILGAYLLLESFVPGWFRKYLPLVGNGAAVLVVVVLLNSLWLPLGPEKGDFRNLLFVGGLIGGLLLGARLFQEAYPRILLWCLNNKLLFLSIPMTLVIMAACTWIGFDKVFSFLPHSIRSTSLVTGIAHAFPGLGKEFMPPLDEGSYLYMPTTMPHAGISEVTDQIAKMDMAIRAIPEIESVVGKAGRVESSLDPAPLSMFENVVLYKPEFILNKDGTRKRFRYDEAKEDYVRDASGELIQDPDGRPFRQWRPEIQTPDDIWKEIVKAAKIPGATSAPKLQPIAARIVMLQSGMRAPMGVKVKGPNLETIERVGLELEKLLKEVPSVEPASVVADRIVGSPYMEITIDREAIARYGLLIGEVQDVIEVALGGKQLTTTVEGRERYPVRVRYQRELRDSLESLGKILIPAMGGAQIPLEQVADIHYISGPQMIKSEDTFLTGYVIFDKRSGYAEVDVVEQAQKYFQDKLASGEFDLPAGTTYAFSGTYENQIRSEKRLMIVMPVALFVIFLILYFQFKRVPLTFFVFTGVFVAGSGGFLMIWLYAQPWFLNFDLFGVNLRTLFQVHPINLSVAIWVGFLALFGIATDDGVLVGTYIIQSLEKNRPDTRADLRLAILEAGKRRIRPMLMTTVTTILALLPVLTSTGRGSDIMIPMAIPSFGGMTIELMTCFVVPTLFCALEEWRLKRARE